MSQPKTPPLSIRLNAATLAAIDKAGASMGMRRHATILMAIGRGLEDWGYPVNTGALSSVTRPKAQAPLGIKRIPPGPALWPSGEVVLPEHIADPGAVGATRLDPDIRGFTAAGEPIMKPKSLARPKPGKAKR